MKLKLILAPLLATLTFTAIQAHANQWGLGIAVAVQEQPQLELGTEYFIFPFPTYEGDRLSLNLASVSYDLWRTENIQLSLEGNIRFDGFDPDDSPALAGMEERNPTFDAGFSITTQRDWGISSLKVLADTLGEHEGVEISASYEYPFQLREWMIAPLVRADWRSEDLVSYYYGVEADEATPNRPSYTGDSTLNLALGFTALTKLSDRWELLAGAEYVFLGDEITDSPIIENDYEALAFSAVVYKF